MKSNRDALLSTYTGEERRGTTRHGGTPTSIPWGYLRHLRSLRHYEARSADNRQYAFRHAHDSFRSRIHVMGAQLQKDGILVLTIEILTKVCPDALGTASTLMLFPSFANTTISSFPSPSRSVTSGNGTGWESRRGLARSPVILSMSTGGTHEYRGVFEKLDTEEFKRHVHESRESRGMLHMAAVNNQA